MGVAAAVQVLMKGLDRCLVRKKTMLLAGQCKGELVNEEGMASVGVATVGRRWVLRWEEAVDGNPATAVVWTALFARKRRLWV